MTTRGVYCKSQSSHMLSAFRMKIRRIFSGNKVVIRRFSNLKSKGDATTENKTIHLHGQLGCPYSKLPIRIATFNVAMFLLAPAISKSAELVFLAHEEEDYYGSLKSPEEMWNQANNANCSSKSILKSPEISLEHSNVVFRSPVSYPSNVINCQSDESSKGGRSIAQVLREVDADILALQDVKAEEENNMKPLSDLAAALGMYYVFAESWAPGHGNAILSKWPIKKSKVQKIADDEDIRNVLKAKIDVPWAGEVNLYCTQLDYLLEDWRMKQISAIIQSNNSPHILAGGLNSLTASDYSSKKWMDIIKDIGKPTPKLEVMKLLRSIKYVDAKDYSGDCESQAFIAKDVQGTYKHGMRVDYILASPDSPYKFVPGSYSVISSNGTSDHHIVKVDITRVSENTGKDVNRRPKINLNKRL